MCTGVPAAVLPILHVLPVVGMNQTKLVSVYVCGKDAKPGSSMDGFDNVGGFCGATSAVPSHFSLSPSSCVLSQVGLTFLMMCRDVLRVHTSGLH